MKYETEYIHRFLKSVLKIDLSLEEISRKHSELDKQSGTPDFYVDNPPTIIELKRVFDRDELEVHKKWESSSNNLANEIKALSDFRKVNKYISVFSGYFVKPKKMLKKIAPSLLNAILDGAKELICDGIHFRIHSIPSDAPDIGFSVVGDARWFSSEKTIAKNLIENIVHANTQIGNFKTLNPGKGIILAVNQYYFGNDYRPYFGALYEDWQKIYSLSSIDEIWILIQSKNGEPQEKMIFSRDIFSMLMAGTAKYADIDIVFFQEAFYYLFKIEVIQETLLRVYGGFVERKHPSDVFSNPDTTEDFIEIGIWLSKEKRYDECAEFIRRYINDPNLSCNVHDTLHKEIISGKSVNYIVSVPGRLSFVIQKLALSPSHFKEALEFTAILLQDENFYVKHQGCIPLIELAAKSRSERVTSNDKQNLKLLLLDSIEKYGNREPIAKRLVEACCFFRDLDENEADLVLNKLGHIPESGSLYVIYGLEWSVGFAGKSSGKLKNKLFSSIRDADLNGNVKSRIVWTISRALMDTKNTPEFNQIFPSAAAFLDHALNLSYSYDIHGMFLSFIEEIADVRPKETTDWFLTVSEKYVHFVKETSLEGFVYFPSLKMLTICAKENPDLYFSCLKNIIALWKLSIHIGSPLEVLTTYKLIEDPSVRGNLASQIAESYKEMQSMQPNLPSEVEFLP